MAAFTQNVTLNGVDPFTLGINTIQWFDARVQRASAFNPEPADSYTLNITLAGAAWRIEQFRLSEFNITTAINDSVGSGRRIEVLRLGDSGTTVNLLDTRIDYIRGFSTENNVINLGSQTTTSVELFNGNDRVVNGSGFTRSIATGDGNDTVVVGQGKVVNVSLDDGNDTLQTSGSGEIESLRAYGNVTVTMSGNSRIEQAFLNGPDVRVTMNDTARMFTLKTGEGTNRITTGNGFFETYHNFNGTNILNLGAGGTGQVLLSGSAGTQTVTSAGYLGSLQVFDNARATVTLNGSPRTGRSSSASCAPAGGTTLWCSAPGGRSSWTSARATTRCASWRWTRRAGWWCRAARGSIRSTSLGSRRRCRSICRRSARSRTSAGRTGR
jgi:hypothetical protein